MLLKIKYDDPRWWTADTPERHVLHNHGISQFFDFKNGDCPPSWILKLNFITAMHFRDVIRITMPNFMESGHTVAEISQFFVFF